MTDPRPHLLAQTHASLEAWACARGASPGGARVLARALLLESVGRSPAESDPRPAARLYSEARAAFDTALPTFEAVPDPDGTVRLVVKLFDGSLVETVLIHHPSGDDAREVEGGGAGAGRANARWTICVSSQVGCRRACAFCETGKLGLARDLAAHEIVAQVLLATREALARGASVGPKNVVFMGMGEPLDNLDAVVQALAVLREQHGLAVPERRVTVSTVGIVPKMPELFARTKANVAVSLHALEPAVRKSLLPVAHKWSIEVLRDAIARAPRTVFLQWTLIEGRNDGAADAARLAEFARGLDVRVNLIPLNPGPDPSMRAPSMEACRAFQKSLLDAGVRALLRMPHGHSVGAACGQLAGARRAAED